MAHTHNPSKTRDCAKKLWYSIWQCRIKFDQTYNMCTPKPLGHGPQMTVVSHFLDEK